MASDLWQNANYRTNAKYIINTYIREYDLSKANINALLYRNKITKEQYDQFMNMPKQQREIAIGLMIKKDYSIYEEIKNGIEAARKMFIDFNNIEDFEIVSIRNDALFISGREMQGIEFGNFVFKVKNIYTVFLKLQDLEIYFGDNDTINSVELSIDVKGISDEKLNFHESGILGLIADVCYRIQRENIADTLRLVTNIYQKYIRRELSKEYYRNFDASSSYTIMTPTLVYSVPEIDQSMVYNIDISRNLAILRDLMSILFDIYRSKNKL